MFHWKYNLEDIDVSEEIILRDIASHLFSTVLEQRILFTIIC